LDLQVHGTVRSLSRPDKVDHLKSLPHAAERLKLFEADLLKPASFDEAVTGCEGVFHTASPFFVSTPKDPEADMLAPAKQGTQAVLAAAKKAGVKSVVVTSSMAAVMIKSVEDGHVWTEKDWSDVDDLRKRERWYPLSKTLAERAAWDFHEAEGEPFKLSVINPCLVVGPMLQPSMNESSQLMANFITGKRTSVPNDCMSFVDVRDTAVAHILAYESADAGGTKATALSTGQGRFTAVAESVTWAASLEALAKGLPKDLAARVVKRTEETTATPTPYDTSTTTSLGITWKSPMESLEDLGRNEQFIAAVRAELA
jgi:nucleoside-diphosphate-sugar epimerase